MIKIINDKPDHCTFVIKACKFESKYHVQDAIA